MEFDENKFDYSDSPLEELSPSLEEIVEYNGESKENDYVADFSYVEPVQAEEACIVPETEEPLNEADELNHEETVESKEEKIEENIFEFHNEEPETLEYSEHTEEAETLEYSEQVEEPENTEYAELLDESFEEEIAEPAPVQSTVVTNNSVMENSNVTISASTINVQASKVVLTSETEEQNSVVDYTVGESKKGGVVLTDDETIIKEYKIVKHGGKAVVTNKRLIVDCDTRLDLPIEKVGGIASSYRNQVQVVKLIFGIIFVGICLFACLFDFSKIIPENFKWACYVIIAVGAVLGLIGVLMICFSFKRKFTLNVYADGLIPVMTIAASRRDAQNSANGIVIAIKRGKDFHKFTGEIGALLLKIKESKK